jgi:hypothetical protein
MQIKKKYRKKYKNYRSGSGCDKCHTALLGSAIEYGDYNMLPVGHFIRNVTTTCLLCHDCYALYKDFEKKNLVINRTDFVFYPLKIIANLMDLTDAEIENYLKPNLTLHKPVFGWDNEEIETSCSSCLNTEQIDCIMNYDAAQDKYLLLCDECAQEITNSFEYMLENWLNEADDTK